MKISKSETLQYDELSGSTSMQARRSWPCSDAFGQVTNMTISRGAWHASSGVLYPIRGKGDEEWVQILDVDILI